MVYPQLGLLTFDPDEEYLMYFDPRLKDMVVFLCIYDGTAYHPIGTGFIVIVLQDDNVFNYLITCKHVVKEFVDAGQMIYLRINRDDKPTVGYQPIKGTWVYHKEKEVDVAVVTMMKFDPGQPFSMMAREADDIMLSERFLSQMPYPVSEGDEVFFIGLFAQHTGNHRNVPVVRFGRVAMISDELVDGPLGMSDYHMIECQAYPGNSGSPLWIGLNYRGQMTAFLFGVITGFYPDQQALYVDPNTLQIYTHFGISIATPIERVREVLYGDVLMDDRKRIIKDRKTSDKPLPASVTSDDDEQYLTRDEFMHFLQKVARPDKPDDDQ